MNELTDILPLVVTIALPVLGGIVWLVRLEGKVKMNQDSIEKKESNQRIMMDDIKEMRKDIQDLSANVMWMRGHMRGEEPHKEH